MLPTLLMLCANAAPFPAPTGGHSANTTITPESPYWDLEVLYDQEKHLEGEKLATERYAETKDPHLTLHIARFPFQWLEGQTEVSKADREAAYLKGLEILDEGIAAAPEDVHLKFARGVILARLGTTRGVLASLRTATDIESAWLATIDSDYEYRSLGTQEQLPCDAYLALGMFYRLVPDMWIVKMLAGTKGDLNKSLQLQEKGAACAPTTIRNVKELGVSQLCLGQKNHDEALIEKGKATINRYLGFPPVMESEILDIKHGVMLLKDPSLACEYSRDGQQDLDEANLKK